MLCKNSSVDSRGSRFIGFRSRIVGGRGVVEAIVLESPVAPPASFIVSEYSGISFILSITNWYPDLGVGFRVVKGIDLFDAVIGGRTDPADPE